MNMSWLAAARRYFGLNGASFAVWSALIAGALGEPLDAQQLEAFHAVFNRAPPGRPARELWLGVGRRGGKNYVSARLAIYLALFREWKLAPGEVGVIMLLAVDRAQVKVAFNYLRGALESHPLLWEEVAGTTADTITLKNGIEIQVGTSDFASVRGRTVLVALLDEYAFWGHEQATEVMRALRPAQATQPTGMIIVISSVYAASGPFFDAFSRYFGSDDPRVLFGRATTRALNPTVSEEFLADEYARDPASAAAEYGSEFRKDITNFLDAGLVDAAIRRSPREIPFAAMSIDGGHVAYRAGLDVSGGRGDAAACAIARVDRERTVIVALRRWPAPHDPLLVAREVAEFLRAYGLAAATADQYAAEFAVAAYREVGVVLMPAEVTRTEAYLHMLPAFTTGRIQIPDDRTLRSELLGLERRTNPSGRDSVDHGPHGHDDTANAVALAAYVSRPAASLTPEALVAAAKESSRALRSTAMDDYVDASGTPGYVPWRANWDQF